MAHIDTVYKRGTAKDRPFKIRKNQAFGPGINDNKSSAILGIYALMLLKKKNFNDYSKITFFINGDEEIGSPNSKETVMTLAMEHDYSLCIEGTSGSDSVASFRNKINERPAFHLNAGTDLLIKKAKKIYLEIEKKLYIQGGGGASDGNYSHEAGTPTLDSLGVVGGRSHSDEEYLDINSIAPRLYLLSRLLMDLGSNK